MFAFAIGALVEVLRGVLGGDHADLKHQVFAGGSDPGDGPPREQRTDPNPVELSDLTRNDLSPDCPGIGGEVVVRRESDLAVAAELDGEVAGGLVYGVAMD